MAPSRMTSKLRAILTVDNEVLKKSIQETLLSFEGGATVDDINTYLWSKGLAVYNQPGFGQLSYAGAMVSGAHGSGITLGPLASYARSVRLFAIDEQHRVVDVCIEPSGGISDPILWHRKHPDVELIQDDELFQSVVVSAGCLGVIHSMTIAVRTSYYLSETRVKLPWDTVKANLASYIGPGAKHQSVAIWLNPYPVGGTVSCVVGTYDYTNQTTSSNARGIGIVLGGTQALMDIIGWISNAIPKAVPTLIDVALASTEDHDVVMTAPDALNFGPPNDISVVASASGFDVEKTVEVAEAVMALLVERAAQTDRYLTSPIGLRFVKKGDAFLGPQYGRDTCMMETPALAGTTEAQETLYDIHRMLATRFDARPHWGQVNHLDAAILQPRFPKFCQFLDAFAVLNPRGFFDNAFTEQLGLRRAAHGRV
jgi:L-gulono-1,4-lactone dehydrogenase